MPTPVLTAEHHGEGIVEFHSSLSEPLLTWQGMFFLGLRAFAVVFLAWIGGFACGWKLLWIWIGISVAFLWKKTGQVQTESLLLVHDLGVQVKRSYLTGRQDCLFVERSRISSVIINEGVGYSSVTYYLAFITKGDTELLLAFSHLIPRIHDLVIVYHATRSIVFGEDVPDWNTASLAKTGPLGKTSIPTARQLFHTAREVEPPSFFNPPTDEEKKMQ